MDNGKPAPALGIFLLFFLLTPVNPCMMLRAVECKAVLAASPFDVSRFGFDVVGLGIDVTTMENAQGTVLDMNSWEDTNGSCTVCMNTLLDGNPVQFLPLAISEWKIDEENCIYENYNTSSTIVNLAYKQNSYIHNQWSDDLDIRWKSKNPVVSIMYWGPKQYRVYYFVGTRSKNMKFAQDRSTKDTVTFFPAEIKCKKYRIRTRKNPPISEALKESLKKLPQNFSFEAREKYMDLIRIYGTHYVVEADLGGFSRSLVNIRSCKLSLAGFSMDEVRGCLRNDIRSALGMTTNNDPTCVRLRSQLDDCTSTSRGGNRNIDLCQMGGNAENFKRWQKELRVSPGLISYKVLPIHLLLDAQDPQRPLLRDAIRRYIYNRSMQLACTNFCEFAHFPTLESVCACKCNFYVAPANYDCCPKQIGISRVTVTIESAWDLRGDWLSEADSSVEVELFGTTFTTEHVWNNNNPVFNKEFNFNIVPLVHGVNKLYFRVKEWSPLGETITDSFTVEIGAGYMRKVQSLLHGHLKFHYHVACAPYLTGHKCREYNPKVAEYENNFFRF